MIDLVQALQLAIDAGMLVLIWLTQLVIYPGLTHFREEELVRWHPIYTQSMTYVVMPLMLLQLAGSLLLLWQDFTLLSIAHLLCILLCWGITFLLAVPAHQGLTNSDDPLQVAQKLVKINWPRTWIWSLAFLNSLVKVIV
jgi:peptidoglycan biosynthesis protein MviN/MurJ (putative lipid II flippase)